MRSGIADSFDDEWWEDYEENPLAEISAEDMIERSASRRAQFTIPGQRTEYTNVNYVILGEIVERVSGEDLGTYINRNILKPLGIKNTIYPANNDLPGDLHGYHANIASAELVDTTIINLTPLSGAGAMFSDIWDLKRWAEAVCTGKLLKAETHRARLQTQPIEGGPAYGEYGEGIVKMGSFCGHGGSVLGFNSAMWYLPQRDATIVVSVNGTNPYDEFLADALAQTIIEILFPKYVSW